MTKKFKIQKNLELCSYKSKIILKPETLVGYVIIIKVLLDEVSI